MNISNQDFNERLFSWYEYNKRNLPWRNTSDPYQIWLSEIILQQTRVIQGLPYYISFLEKFPTVTHLANASEQEVLRLWQGLGYYSRARNMHFTAKTIVNDYHGIFPNTYAGLLKLKGIGTYTAAAIASFAFKEEIAVVDGNVFRVLSRTFGIQTDINSPTGKKQFTQLANTLIPNDKPDTFNQALMEFGALQCKPQSPDCSMCPFNTDCIAFLEGRQSELPVKINKTTVKGVYFHYLIFEFENKIALKKRENKDIWQGLYDFYLLESNEFKPLKYIIDEGLLKEIEGLETLKTEKVYIHQLSHRKIHAKFWQVKLADKKEAELIMEKTGLVFYDMEEVNHLPKPILIVNYLKDNFFSGLEI